ncbi:MAG: CPBP family intramembrane metalloprotease [Butyrivibrio sp.]|nr:CPBP family intramembrane metalloprotease [Butyrivibrio sp.]
MGVSENNSETAENEVQMQESGLPRKKLAAGYCRGIVNGLLYIMLFLALQVVGAFVCVIGYMIIGMTQTGADPGREIAELANRVQTPGIMTNITFISILIEGAVIYLIFRAKCKPDRSMPKEQRVQKRQRLISSLLNSRTILLLVSAIAAVYGMALLISYAVSAAFPGAEKDFESIMDSATGGNPVIAFLTVVILAPVLEEMALRGIVMKLLAKYMPVKGVIIVQAVLFGIYHMNLMQVFYVLPLALLLGYTAYHFGSIIPCIGIHMLNNLMPYFFSLLHKKEVGIMVPVVILAAASMVFLLTWKFVPQKDKAEA